MKLAIADKKSQNISQKLLIIFNMSDHSIITPNYRFNVPISLLHHHKDGVIILKYFEGYGSLYAPRKFIISSHEDSEYEIAPIEVELKHSTQTNNYEPHYLGFSFDTSKVMLEITAVRDGSEEEELIMNIAYQLHYSKGNDNDGNAKLFPINPIKKIVTATINREVAELLEHTKFKITKAYNL